MDRRLLQEFLEIYPFQPATAIWRAPEVAALARVQYPAGLGLDLGCGDGRLTRVLAQEVGGLRLVGLDADPLETRLAEAETVYERVHTCAAAQIPEPANSFEFVLSVSVMEHIPNLDAVLTDVARVLKPGGRLITTVPGVGFHRCLRGPILPGVARADYLRTVDRRVAHLRYWTIAQWKSALARAGLRHVASTPILSRGDVRRWESAARVTAGILHAVTRHKPPVEIQRALGLRKPGQRMPRAAAALLARVLSLGLDDARPQSEWDAGCLLVIATRDR